MEGHVLVILSIIFILAYLNKILSPKLNLPEVTGYVILGVLASAIVSPFIGREHFESAVGSVEIISSLALAIIGFTIGCELKWKTLKKLGSSVIWIVGLETVGTFLIVGFVLKLIGFELYTALLLGAVASATAPAATVAVIRQYKAKGSLTSTILAVVGIDDAFALVIYVIASSFAKDIIKGTDMQIMSIAFKVIFSIGASVISGLVFGYIYLIILKRVKDNETIEMLLIGFLLALLAVSEILGISELLTIMTFGAALANSSAILTKKSEHITDKFTSVLVGAFFIAGGAHLDISVVSKVFVFGVIYFVVRAFGKIAGASLGAFIGKAPSKVKKYVGLSLIPQVGVALALAISIKKEFTGVSTRGYDLGYFVFNILLFTTLITELVGPLLTKKVLLKAGEIKPKEV